MVELDLTDVLQISDEVAAALRAGEPVVALESTIISHGMPAPENLQTAQRLEQTVRDNGAVPATVAVLEGRICVGLSSQQINYLANSSNKIHKVSRRDLPVLLARREAGATTVATTMLAAAMAGIAVFATGGIGGVHRGATESFDVSADLLELAQTPVAVVCAGVKSILDIGLTLEYLETHGVPVLGYQTGEMPAFYTRDSGHSLEHVVESPGQVAEIIHAQQAISGGGIVVANPVPADAALPRAEIEATIAAALDEMRRQGVIGKDVTPFLLQRVAAATGGRSLAANIALVLNNAALAARIARELH